MSEASLKLRTARAVKWNSVDRLGSQVIYGITGLVLAWLLTPDDYGLVGAVLIFQAFASLIVDSGFSYALLQRKEPTSLDYSTVFWFNIGVAAFIYIILFLAAPLIALCFEDDQRLIPLSRVSFLTFILNALSIVQQNRFVKQMNVRPVAAANLVSLCVGGIAGLVLAFAGYGAWAMVWQYVVTSAVKAMILWFEAHWTPLLRFSMPVLRSFFRVGGSMMFSSALNTFFQYIYSFVIGNRLGFAPLGYYTQGDKWSKMGVMSIMQTLTSSFLPTLSAVQDEKERFRALCSKMNRMTAYITFPVLGGLAMMATPIFHTLFHDKWDLSIALFQLLLIRGIFTVITGVYNNHIISLGKSKLIMYMEIVRDLAVIAALAVTFPFMTLKAPGDTLLGIRILLWGQVAAAFIAWSITLVCVCRATGSTILSYCLDLAPYALLTLATWPLVAAISCISAPAFIILLFQSSSALFIYIAANYLLKSKIQADVIAFISGKMKK